MSKHVYENHCTLFPALKAERGFYEVLFLWTDLSALMQLSIITFGVGFYILVLL